MDKQNYYLVNLLLISLKYSELKELRDDGLLIPGYHYRITDYVTTTVRSKTKSAGNVFDVIVLATSANELSHIARAIQHEGDTYFDGNDLGAWELWYDLDNDTEKYEWADATNGKGVIYRMIDEKGNDCPYDFKNILFYNSKLTASTTSDKYYYIFSYVVSGKLYDGTVEKQVFGCHSNRIGLYYLGRKLSLNSNVFRNTSFTSPCNSNTFGTGCYSNTFGTGCYGNTLGDSCVNNTFGKNCDDNTFGNICNYNTFGNSCNSNTFGTGCYDNTFGNICNYNTFGNSCSYNTFGNLCSYNTFGNNCQDRSIDDNKTSIIINEEYYDDGSGQLVPIKHPDLSTQPSILPYKFMGQYVYEKLLYLGKKKDYPKQIFVLGFEISNSCLILQANIIVYEEVSAGLVNGCTSSVIPVTASIDMASRAPETTIIDFDYELPELAGETPFSDNADIYAKIVYTSMPVESGYYGQEYNQ